MKVFISSLSGRGLFAVVLFLYWTIEIACDAECPWRATRPVEFSLYNATAVFHGVILEADKETGTLEMALATIYKGGTALAAVSPYEGSVYNTTDRQVTVKMALDLRPCYEWNITKRNEIIVFVKINDPEEDGSSTPADAPWLEAMTQPLPWSETMGDAVWHVIGWSEWTEWGACSKTCGGGYSMRSRTCKYPDCEGFSEQLRSCNTFECEGTINPLATDFRKNFHPAQSRWSSVPDRPHAFSLSPNSYIWISSSELVPGENFPKEFTVFLSLRLRTKSSNNGQGTLFSLRSRRKDDSFLSLELIGHGEARLVHTGQGDTKAINFTVPLYDFRWHYIALSVHDDSTVKAYVDCKWLRTDVLKKNSLATPKDADIIIGYLYSGDLEQLSIVPRAGEAINQCSNQVTEIPNEHSN